MIKKTEIYFAHDTRDFKTVYHPYFFCLNAYHDRKASIVCNFVRMTFTKHLRFIHHSIFEELSPLSLFPKTGETNCPGKAVNQDVGVS